MVILGLGSNLGERLTYLRQAFTLLKKIPNFTIQQVSPVYISDALVPEDAPADWVEKPYLNLALRCDTSLTPYELLSHTKRIEIEVGRKPGKNWGPRIIDIDLLAWDNLTQYDEKLHIPHENLTERPFALWPLADIAPYWVYPLPGSDQGKTAAEIVARWGSRFSGEAPWHTQQIQQRIDTPELVGILNVTPDSFSDGGNFINPAVALKQMETLVEAGADIIDIGAEATGPNAIALDPAAEWARLQSIFEEVLPSMSRWRFTPKISLDTRHASIAKKALAYKVDLINDVSGLMDSEMQELIASQNCKAVFMHHLGIPVDKNKTFGPHENVCEAILNWAEKHISHLEKKGIAKEKLIFDVGIGYGKTPEQSLELIRNIDFFRSLELPLLIGHSRKSFFQNFTAEAPKTRDLETTVVSLYLADKGVEYLRVHNVEMHSRAFKIQQSL